MVNKVWIGLATVKPIDGNVELGEVEGATFNVLYCAKNIKEYRDKVKEKLLEYGYYLEDLENIEIFNFDKDHKDNLNELARTAALTNSLQWGTFYTF